MRKKRLLERIEALEREVAELRERGVWVYPHFPAYVAPTPTMPDVMIPSIWDNSTWVPDDGVLTSTFNDNDLVLWATPDGCHWYAEEKAGFSTCG